MKKSKYTQKLKNDLVKRYKAGEAISKLTKESGVSHGSIRNWINTETTMRTKYGKKLVKKPEFAELEAVYGAGKAEMKDGSCLLEKRNDLDYSTGLRFVMNPGLHNFSYQT